MSRNYRDLSPYDFETLARDLLQEEMGERLETFPQGRDGGVDIRLFKNGSEQLIVQCKHTPGKRYSEIKAQLQGEAGKIGRRFSGKRYMLITSASLTRTNKSDIAALFKGVALSENDVWGVEDLENYLGLHPRVEQRNFKLWITSTAVMARLLHSGIYERSSGLFEDIKQKARVYVQNDAYPIALKMLQDNSVCLISGEPGVGKSTLSEMLILRSLDEGWTAYRVSEDVSEIDAVWNPDERQIFYYDDFLGQNTLADKLNKNEDSRIMQVVNRIQRSQGKRLVMTTREYILQRAIQVYEPLHRNRSLASGKIILKLSHYSTRQKSHILYNHVYFSDMPAVARQSVIADKTYRRVVTHPNYNPRLIELVTATYDSDSGSSFAEYIEEALEDPSHLWEVIFENQMSDTERNILLVLATFTLLVSVSDLELATHHYERQTRQPVSSTRNFKQALKRLQGTFLNLAVGEVSGSRQTVATVRLANPSFNDYICQYLISRTEEVGSLIDGAFFFEQLRTLWGWHNGSYVTVDDVLAAFLMSISGSRRRRPATHMIYEFTEEYARALFRTMDGRSVAWGRRHESYYLLDADYPGRYIEVLRMDEEAGFRILAPDMVDAIQANALVRLETEGQDVPNVRSYVYILSLIMRTSKCSKDVTKFQKLAYEIACVRNEEPADYENRWDLLELQESLTISGTGARKAELAEEFLRFAVSWDIAQAENVESASDCEELLGELVGVAEKFGVDSRLCDLKLDEAFLALKDKELDDAFEYADYADGEEGGNADSALPPEGGEEFGEFRDEIDDLFDTLME